MPMINAGMFNTGKRCKHRHHRCDWPGCTNMPEPHTHICRSDDPDENNEKSKEYPPT